MAAPVLASSYPSQNQTDVYINKSFYCTFAAALSPSSVDENTFFIIESLTNLKVPATVSYDNSIFKVTLSLYGSLIENTQYKLYIVGTDSKVTKAVTDSDGITELANTIIITFTTGDDAYDIDTTVEKDAKSKTLEGELFLPQNVKALGQEFVVKSVDPPNFKDFAPSSLNGSNQIVFTFNKPLLVPTDISTYVSSDLYPILMEDYIYANSAFNYKTPVTVPSVSANITGSNLILTYSSSIPFNMGIDVILSTDIKSLEGDLYGENLYYTISLESYPKTLTTRTIQRELRAVQGDKIKPHYISALLTKNAIFLYELLGKNLDLTNLPFSAKKYVMYSTILDIIEDQDYEKVLASGARTMLSDLSLSQDAFMGKLAIKAANAKKKLDESIETLKQGWQMKTAVLGGNFTSTVIPRLWYGPNGRFSSPSDKYYQDSSILGNNPEARQAKTTNPYII
jgi:hypothetical protein